MSKVADRVTNVKTPGVIEAPAVETNPEELMAATPGFAPGDPSPKGLEPGAFVTITAEQLEAVVARSVNSALAARAAAAAPLKEADLPDQSELDPKTLKAMTLSKQGWVVPLSYGEPADPSIKR